MKTVYLKRAFKLAAVGIAMVVLYFFFADLLKFNNTNSELHVRNFYREPENTIDVGLIGASEMYADYSAPLAYQEYGFTSYNLCVAGTTGGVYKSMIREMLSRQTPQLLVIEVNGFLYNVNSLQDEGTLRQWIDNMEKNDNWLDTISERIEPDDRKNYYVRLLKYHSNWENPKDLVKRQCDIDRNNESDVSLCKSMGIRTQTNPEVSTAENKSKLTDLGKSYLEETIAYCQEKGLKNVLFIRAPHNEKLNKKTNQQIEEIITQNGYAYMNFEYISEEFGIDDKNDYFNTEHLNVFGCEKFTDYLSRYITENYTIETEHSEDVDAEWNKCAEHTNAVFDTLKERTLKEEGKYYTEFSDMKW